MLQKDQYIIYNFYFVDACLGKITSIEYDRTYKTYQITAKFIDLITYEIEGEDTWFMYDFDKSHIVMELPIGTTEEEARIIFAAYKDKEGEKYERDI